VLATAQEYLAAHPAEAATPAAGEMEFTPEMEDEAGMAAPETGAPATDISPDLSPETAPGATEGEPNA
jgi:hypothetical protein